MVCRDVFVDVSVSGSVLFVYFVSVKEFGLIGREIPMCSPGVTSDF